MDLLLLLMVVLLRCLVVPCLGLEGGCPLVQLASCGSESPLLFLSCGAGEEERAERKLSLLRVGKLKAELAEG